MSGASAGAIKGAAEFADSGITVQGTDPSSSRLDRSDGGVQPVFEGVAVNNVTAGSLNHGTAPSLRRVVSSEECSDYLGAGKVFAGGEGIGGCGVCPGLLPWGFGCLGLPRVGMGAGLMPPVFRRPTGIMELTIYDNCGYFYVGFDCLYNYCLLFFIKALRVIPHLDAFYYSIWK